MAWAADNTFLSAIVAKSDFPRVRRLAGDLSMNTFLRGLVSDALEEAGEAPLGPPAGGPRTAKDQAYQRAYMRRYRGVLH